MLVLPLLAVGHVSAFSRVATLGGRTPHVAMCATPSDPLLDSALLAHRIASHRKVSEVGDVFVPVLRAEGREGLFSVRGAGEDCEYVVAFEAEADADLACVLINAQREHIFADESEAATIECVPAIDVWQYVQSTVQDRREAGTHIDPVALAIVRPGELRNVLSEEWLERMLWGEDGAEAISGTAADENVLPVGCTDTLAVNFSSYAMVDDGTCVYA